MNDRPSVWLVGMGAGMAAAGGTLAAHVYSGAVVALWWAYYPMLGVTVMGAVIVLSGLGSALAGGVTFALDTYERVQTLRRPPPAEEYAPDDDPGPLVDPEAEEDAWAVTLRIFFRNGEVAGGFSHSRLVEAGGLSEGAWTELTTFYASDAGGRVLRLDTAAGYVLGYGWSYDTVREKITRRLLPHPTGSPPEVVPIPFDTTRRDTRRQRQTVEA